MHLPERITWAVDQLPRPERVLEVGCGSGHALALICARFPDARATGIDRSAAQVERARARCREHITAGRALVERRTLDEAPAAYGAVFDAVLAVNVNAFWATPAPGFASLARLLRPGGRAFLVYEPPAASRADALRRGLAALADGHGFAVEDARETAFRASRGLCIVCRPAGAG